MTNSNAIQVLSVDGSEESRLALRSCLSDIQSAVLADEATSPSEALEKLKEKPIDVVLLALVARDLESIELTKRIRRSHPTVRVVIVTASDTPEDIFAALDAGADGYLLKGNLSKALAIAISSVRLGAVWLDPGIARQVLEVMVTTITSPAARMLQTGVMPMPFIQDERDLLSEVAASDCKDGVCLVDPSFLKKLRRFAPSAQ